MSCAGGEVRGIRAPQAGAASELGLTLAKLVVERRGRGLGATVAEAILASGLPRALQREGGERAAERLERLRDIVRAARAFQVSRQPGGLVGFLAHAALVSSDADEQSERVSLATVHAAKGLEWRCVRVVGVEEGLMPHERALEGASAEEERRLAYVAMTRAREQLVLTWARSRGGHRQARSRFLAEAGICADTRRRRS